jgi:predicted PurR-regulated permease PerM
VNQPSDKQLRIVWFALTALSLAAVVAVIAAAVWGLAQVLDLLSPVIWPLAIAGIVACVLAPLVEWLERHRVPRTRAILLVFTAAFLIVAGTLASVIPQVMVETRELAGKVPEYSQRLQSRLGRLLNEPPAIVQHFLPHHTVTPAPIDTNTSPATINTNAAGNPGGNSDQNAAPQGKPNGQAINSAAGMVTDALPKISSWLLKQGGKVLSGFGMLAGLALVPVYAFYFLREQKDIESRWKNYLPLRDSRAKEEAVFILESIGQYLVAFFRGQVLVAICNAILYTIGFLAIGLRYAFLIGFSAVLLTMIPFLGSIIIFITALTLALVQYTDWLHPLLVLAVFAVVQTMESLVVSPKIMGDRVGLPPVIIIIAVMVGTTLLGGILGGVLAIPLAAALRVILLRYVWKKQPEV